MEDKDYIKELFSEKLRNQEAPVNPELWSSISASIGSSAVSTAMALSTKIIIGISAAAVVTVASFVALKDDKPEAQKVNTDKTQEAITPKTQETQQVADAISNDGKTTFVETAKAQTLLEDGNEVIHTNPPVEVEELPIKTIAEPVDPADKKAKEEPIVFGGEKQEEKKAGEPSGTGSANPNNPELKVKYTLGKLPTAFSPNGDNINDLFFIESTGLIDFSLTIVDAKGDKVFSTTDPNFKWDGTNLAGEELPEGDYIYFFVAKDELNNPVTKSNSLAITKRK